MSPVHLALKKLCESYVQLTLSPLRYVCKFCQSRTVKYQIGPFQRIFKTILIKEQVSVRGTGMFCRAFLADYNGNESQKAMIWSYGRMSVTTVSSNMGGNGIFGCQGVHTVELSSPCR